MKRIYLDWNIFTQIKNPNKEPYIGIANKIEQIKDFVLIPYTTAHLSDLKKGYKNEEPFISFTNYDLSYLSQTCKNFHWYYNESKKAVEFIYESATDKFESYKENGYSIEDAMDFEKLFSGMAGMETVGAALTKILESIQVPLDFSTIPNDLELKGPLQSIFQTKGKTTSMMELMRSLLRFCDEINKDPVMYKDLRNKFRTALKLPSDMSNWKEDTWNKLDNQMTTSLLNKSFTNMVIDAAKGQEKNKEITFHDEFLHAYMNLDLLGFSPESLSKKNTYANLFNDSQHAFFAAHSNIFVTNDSNTRAKTRVIYDKYGITTEILTAEEFLEKLNNEIKVVELFNETPNSLKLDHLILTRVPNLDGSDFDYKIEHVDFLDKRKTLLGTCDLILGNINFVETKGIGIPFGTMKLLYEWINANLEENHK